jgi:hypothetical protein
VSNRCNMIHSQQKIRGKGGKEERQEERREGRGMMNKKEKGGKKRRKTKQNKKHAVNNYSNDKNMVVNKTKNKTNSI